jgi:hypothetical protein
MHCHGHVLPSPLDDVWHIDFNRYDAAVGQDFGNVLFSCYYVLICFLFNKFSDWYSFFDVSKEPVSDGIHRGARTIVCQDRQDTGAQEMHYRRS